MQSGLKQGRNRKGSKRIYYAWGKEEVESEMMINTKL